MGGEQRTADVGGRAAIASGRCVEPGEVLGGRAQHPVGLELGLEPRRLHRGARERDRATMGVVAVDAFCAGHVVELGDAVAQCGAQRVGRFAPVHGVDP